MFLGQSRVLLKKKRRFGKISPAQAEENLNLGLGQILSGEMARECKLVATALPAAVRVRPLLTVRAAGPPVTAPTSMAVAGGGTSRHRPPSYARAGAGLLGQFD